MCIYFPLLDEATERWGLACTLHGDHPWPCPFDTHTVAGLPLLPCGPAEGAGDVHVDRLPTREAALAYARSRTHGERPIVVHAGSRGFGDHPLHQPTRSCWCGPEVTR
ncbi:hypothetical protein [Actinomadura violacea]|uniref:Uncharacterized protein n=1 Tax=Actinomadura violacea TaxID=2819934 RepID=A0ABS3RYC5_9ACTN|nr:hypothetical protein [Actinomadura violacea]MBO2461646.1 hypothetical protein [Actinomadura violacea]